MKLKLFFLVLAVVNFASAQTWFQTGQNADLMLSGVDFNNTGGPLLFNHPTGLASDGARLLLCDRFNNRVLIWNTLPTQWNAQPDLVLGQSDFFGNNPGTTKSGMNWPGNVSVGSNGLVAVADTENDRLLIWKNFPSRKAQAADIAISLPAITPAGNAFSYGWPWGVWTDGTRLVAVATDGASLLFWNTMPSRDDQPADYAVNLAQFGTIRNISTDGATYFFTGDHNAKVNGGAGTFFWNSFPAQTNQPYDFFREEWIKGAKLPDGKLVAGGLSSIYVWDALPTAAAQNPSLAVRNNFYKNGDGPDVAYAGGRLYLNNYNGNNVHVYNSVPTQANQMPDFALGSPTVTANTLDSINYIQNPVIATDGSVLVVSSDFDAMLWLWKTLPQKSGLAADVKIALRGFDLLPWDNALHNGRLVLAGKQRVGVWNTLPLNGEAPAYVLSNQIGSVPLQDLRGVALDDKYFYLADANGTLAIWNGIPTTGNEEPLLKVTLTNTPLNHLHSDGTYLCVAAQSAQTAVYVYRVSDFAAGGNPQPYKTVDRNSGLPLNQAASAITFNGGLVIANRGNHSVLLWQDVATAGDPGKVIVLGQPSLNSTSPAIGVNRLFMPSAVAAHGNFLWVGEGKFSSRLLRFSDGTATSVAIDQSVVHGYQLAQNYPNPFNPTTVISFQLPVSGHVTLKVFDVRGREVATLVDGNLAVGNHSVTFTPRELAGGIYFYQLTAGNFSQTRKAVLMK